MDTVIITGAFIIMRYGRSGYRLKPVGQIGFYFIKIALFLCQKICLAESYHVCKPAHGPGVAAHAAGVVLPTGRDSDKNRFGAGSVQDKHSVHGFLCVFYQGSGIGPIQDK